MMQSEIPIRIESFTGRWNFLSNFYPVSIVYEGQSFASVEHAYQAAKTQDIEKRWVFTQDNPRLTAAQAKRLGRKLQPMRPDWEEVKKGIMRELLTQKFSNPMLKMQLLSTQDAEIVEGNYWHDTYWGVCNGGCQSPHEPIGENWLGRLAMEVRHFLSSQLESSRL